jgi:NAD(P)-dependent dehydrogenase (short-subunit alcohol dehydrogenase family)
VKSCVFLVHGDIGFSRIEGGHACVVQYGRIINNISTDAARAAAARIAYGASKLALEGPMRSVAC